MLNLDQYNWKSIKVMTLFIDDISKEKTVSKKQLKQTDEINK